MKKLIILSVLLCSILSAEAQFTGGGTTGTSSNNKSNDSGDLGLRKYFFLGYGVVNGWGSDVLTEASVTPPFSLTWAYGINENMSWGIGAHIGVGAGNYSKGFESETVGYLHWSVYGQYYYHFLPRDSRFDLAAVGTLGYAKANVLDEDYTGYSGDELPRKGIKFGVAGLAKIRLGKKFGFYGKVGFDPTAGHVQVGLAWGR